MQRRLQDCARDSVKAFDPFPTLMPVHLFEMVEIVFHAERVVIPAATVDNDPSLLRHTVQQLREIRHIREVPWLVDHEYGNIEFFSLERMGEARYLAALLAVHRDLVTELM